MNKHLFHSLSRVLFITLFLTFMGGEKSLLAASKTVIIDGVKYKYSKNSDYLIVVNAAYSGDIVIPETADGLPVKQIGSSAFSELMDLKSVTLPNSIELIDNYAFDSSENLEKVVLGNSLKKIGNWAFRNCINLEEMEFPKSLETIENYCFDKNLKLEKITIPENVTLMGGFVFEGNPQLTKIYSLATTPPAIRKGNLDGEDIYTLFDDNDYGERTLYVPKGTKDAYKLSFGWNQFKYVEEIETTSIENTVDGNRLTAFSTSKGELCINSGKDASVAIYDTSGRMLVRESIKAGTTTFTGLPGGIVIINNKKVIVK